MSIAPVCRAVKRMCVGPSAGVAQTAPHARRTAFPINFSLARNFKADAQKHALVLLVGEHFG